MIMMKKIGDFFTISFALFLFATKTLWIIMKKEAKENEKQKEKQKNNKRANSP